MELGEEERYAAAALFSLALHLTQVQYGATQGEHNLPGAAAWGQPPEDDEADAAAAGPAVPLPAGRPTAAERAVLARALQGASWGADLVGEGGLLERLYSGLALPRRAWPGLKRLPEVGGITDAQRPHYMMLVSNHMKVLDASLPTQHLRGGSQRAAPAASVAPGSPAAAANALNSTLMSALIHGQGAPAVAGAPTVSSEAPASAKAVCAVWELLEACIVKSGDAAAATPEVDGPGGGPRVRWYDARARTALRRVAAWLNVPWTKVATFERLLAYQLMLPERLCAKAELTAWQRGIRAAKIGATGVGIGAMFAVTGGLAAPAIAAGIGAAISLVGGAGAAAAAASASGFLATAAGTAATAASMGVAGGSFAGSRMARRVGDVKEFGFVELVAGEVDDLGSPRSGSSTAGMGGSDVGAPPGSAAALQPPQVAH
ncbi:hypothetical protein WJX81_006684, partial [Elliptochloris bilobata]